MRFLFGDQYARASWKNRPSSHIAASSILPGAETSAASCVRRRTRSPGSGRTASTVKSGSISTFHRHALAAPERRSASFLAVIATSPSPLCDGGVQDHTVGSLRTKGATLARTPRAPRLRKSASVGPSRRWLTLLSVAHMAGSSPAAAASSNRSRAPKRAVESWSRRRRCLAGRECAERGQRGDEAHQHYGKKVQARAAASPPALVNATAVCRPGFREFEVREDRRAVRRGGRLGGRASRRRGRARRCRRRRRRASPRRSGSANFPREPGGGPEDLDLHGAASSTRQTSPSSRSGTRTPSRRG